MELTKTMQISAAGIRAQSVRMRIIAENMANASSVANSPGGKPYQRKTVSFTSHLDRALGANLVGVGKVGRDKTPFPKKYDPGHPSADGDGYVIMPNVNGLVEAMDMREAQRSYEAGLSVIESSKNMLAATIDLLR